MLRQVILTTVLFSTHLAAQFEVATIKPIDPQEKAGRYITMQGDHRFIAKNYTLNSYRLKAGRIDDD